MSLRIAVGVLSLLALGCGAPRPVASPPAGGAGGSRGVELREAPTPQSAPAPGPETAAPAGSLRQVLTGLLPPAGTRLVIDNVERMDSPVAGSLAKYLLRLISEEASALPGVTLVNPTLRNRVLALLAEGSGDAYDPESLPELGRHLAPQHVLRCTYTDLSQPPRVRLSLELVELETNEGRQAPCILLRDDLPPGLSSEPSNKARIEGQIERWREAVADPPFAVEVWTDRGHNGAYQAGEALRIFVRSERAGRLSLELLDVEGAVTPLFPNAFHAGDRLAAARTLEIPDEAMAFELKVSGAPGAELLRAVVIGDDGARSQTFCAYVIEPPR